jgi:hypothetical protein
VENRRKSFPEDIYKNWEKFGVSKKKGKPRRLPIE